MKKRSFIYSVWFICSLIFCLSCEEDDHSIQVDFEASQNKIMAGEKVIFNDLSVGKISAWNWTFEGGTPATSQLSQPEVTYNKPGEYAVMLEVRNADGVVQLAKEKFVVVGNSKVTANFTSDVVSVMNDTPVTFTDLSTGTVSNWKWTFTSLEGEVIASTEQHPQVLFTVPSIYSVSLEVSNEEFSDLKTVENYIQVIDATKVIANFESDKQFTYAGGKVTFTDKSVGRVTSWLWSFEGADISSSTSQHPQVTFTSAGIHKVSMTASNGSVDDTIVKEGYVRIIPSNALSAFLTFDKAIRDELSDEVTSKVKTLGNITFETADRKNVTGNTAYFDGTGGFIIGDDDAFNMGTGNYTVAVWLKVGVEYSTTRMVAWQESGAGATGDDQTWLRLYSTATNQLTFATEDAAGGSTLHLTSSNSSVNNIANGEWRHVVCVRDGLVTSVYIDGVFIRSVTSSKGIKNVSNAGTFKVGCQESGVGNYTNKFIGAIDDLIVYKRALSAQEIAELYQY